ncbi:unnamed protein product [Colletotrichum noveboracense]|uniref:Fungal N-terminal domain-containing protein n=2 Tax=Colletotrichum gloeosporioides species complex TaxID=2707338 RepID=A0A9W4S6D7_9PEZI|nr:hypothetical protein K456DRAFT_1731653 [Colletotrichum gloeosporioides 23]KAK1844982.1 hypothetical protein CCHR01_12394 [Colletotrichum chrysophilum]CAI0653242.1 unnamed protein product [Colletotrichum noveboracense]
MADAVDVSSTAGHLEAAVQLSAAVSRQIDAISDAPRVLTTLSADLQEVLSILETLLYYLSNDDTAKGVLHPSTARDLDTVLKKYAKSLCLLEEKLEKATEGRSGGKLGLWKRTMLTLQAKEFTDVREQLATQKIMLNISVAVSNFINTTYEATPENRKELVKMKTDVANVLLKLDHSQRRQFHRRCPSLRSRHTN